MLHKIMSPSLGQDRWGQESAAAASIASTMGHCKANLGRFWFPHAQRFLNRSAFVLAVALAHGGPGPGVARAGPTGRRRSYPCCRSLAARSNISRHSGRPHFWVRGFRRPLEAAGARQFAAGRRHYRDCSGPAGRATCSSRLPGRAMRLGEACSAAPTAGARGRARALRAKLCGR